MRRILLWGIGWGALLLPLLPVPSNNGTGVLDIDEQLRRMSIPVANGSKETTTDLFTHLPDLFSRENLSAIYLLVAALFALRFIDQWVGLFALYRKSKTEYWVDGTPLQVLPGAGDSFSFFRWIFLYEKNMKNDDLSYVIAHEAAHGRGWHSLDICFGQVLTVICWLNPMAWMYWKETKRLTEFLADRQVLRQGFDRKEYQLKLLHAFCGPKKMHAGCHFNTSELRLRIVMMNRKAGHRHYRVAVAALLILLVGIPLSYRINRYVHPDVPGTSSARSELQAVWVMRHPDKETPTYSYKLLNKDGSYLNLRSYDDRQTFTILRQGTYRIVAPGIYIENLKEEFGNPVYSNVEIAMNYQIENDRLKVSFRLGERTYSEVWERLHEPMY